MSLFKKKEKSEESYYLASQWTLIRKKLMAHKLAVTSMIVLGILYTTALFANFLAPYGLEDFSSDYKNATPTAIHWMKEGAFVGPHVYKMSYTMNKETFKREWEEDTSVMYPLKFFVKRKPYRLFGIIPSDVHLFGTEAIGDEEPPRILLFGGDNLGNDLFSRVLIGSQISLTIPFVGTLISFVLGVFLGGISGYFGGMVDNVIQRVIEVLSALPTIPLWMALSAAIPPDIPVAQMYLMITMIISLISWTGLARVVRGQFYALKNEDYIVAARIAGVSNMKIILKHMVPGFMSYLIVNLTLGIPNMIIGETSMSFLGLGMRSPATSWGVLLKETQDINSVAQYPWRLIPLIAVIVTVLAFNFLGDGMRDAADPYK
ncbi:ABC transporter permease [Fusibacter sp. 3D3]|uniref:ABC transporter permease n=1 Tax=Fusibacter sp. 3D3 TaxID=1048380 RepID=UPI000852995A|nr:ABC transporter permease [Fusibacter sp. 3D3]GAU76669.1 oligopeptide transport system permease protein OppC [Fusibacter sp. 3D3]